MPLPDVRGRRILVRKPPWCGGAVDSYRPWCSSASCRSSVNLVTSMECPRESVVGCVGWWGSAPRAGDIDTPLRWGRSPAGQACRDLLQDPAVAVRIAEHRVRLVAPPLGIPARQPDTRDIGVEPPGRAVEDLAHLGAEFDELRPRGRDVLHDQQQPLLRPGG